MLDDHPLLALLGLATGTAIFTPLMFVIASKTYIYTGSIGLTLTVMGIMTVAAGASVPKLFEDTTVRITSVLIATLIFGVLTWYIDQQAREPSSIGTQTTGPTIGISEPAIAPATLGAVLVLGFAAPTLATGVRQKLA